MPIWAIILIVVLVIIILFLVAGFYVLANFMGDAVDSVVKGFGNGKVGR